MRDFSDNASCVDYKPSYNIAPQAFTPVLKHSSSHEIEYYDLKLMKWGLKVSSFKPEQGIHNARLETLTDKPSFRYPLAAGQTCVVVAEGFFEWKQHKNPYYITPKNEVMPLLLMAGLYTINDKGQYSYTVITTESNFQIKPIHHRMPVIFTDPDDVHSWLHISKSDSTHAIELLHAITKKLESTESFDLFPVSPQVNNTANDTRYNVMPLAQTPASKMFDNFLIKK
ncbi:hypothetical protein Ciccas_008577 [Cichlidogyrus casuarinus]|uniref:Abasic site processing protein HMCES n=1 Tax=Cichlidogyrus casuarinus TaxID=1844966 RepID=A0ABD2Q0E4_9PLAT